MNLLIHSTISSESYLLRHSAHKLFIGCGQMIVGTFVIIFYAKGCIVYRDISIATEDLGVPLILQRRNGS